LRTWLTGILVNCCRERLRGQWRWVEPDDAAPKEQADDVLPLEQTLGVERAIASLPPGSRSVFVLHDIHGHTHQEIAALLDIEPGTSKSQLFHARRQLRALLT
jgi:RNA polymerase sigma-70 factor (ECF subfamily)